jgi:2,3-bisphosphoglycerate-dependent phosphoglycerate mutase
MIGSMRREYASLRRRPFLAPVWILTLGAIVTLALAGWAVHAASTTLVVVVRHADKANDGTLDPPLSPAGIERAARLAAILSGTPDFRLDAVFVTQFRRSVATAEPLATVGGIPIIRVADDDVAGLARRIESDYRGRRVLVVAHSDTIPQIVNRLGETSRAPPVDAAEYGTAYVIAMPRWGRPNVLRLSLP